MKDCRQWILRFFPVFGLVVIATTLIASCSFWQDNPNFEIHGEWLVINDGQTAFRYSQISHWEHEGGYGCYVYLLPEGEINVANASGLIGAKATVQSKRIRLAGQTCTSISAAVLAYQAQQEEQD